MAQRVTTNLLERIARAAIGACHGAALTGAALSGRVDRPWIVGAGKAVGAMAEGARRALGDRFRAGPLIGKHADHSSLPILIGGHPLPNERGVAASRALLRFLRDRTDDEPIVLLLSGGASALLAAPIPGATLDQTRRATERLLRSGASIGEINTVRRHLGLLLGGRLAKAVKGPLEVFALSDVIGDDPSAIGSGPASVDPTTFADALSVARAYGLDAEIALVLERGVRGELEETVKPGDARLADVPVHILATPVTLRDRAAEAISAAGLRAVVGPADVRGEVATLSESYGGIARSLAPGEIYVAVGEPTVALTGDGRGGRAQHLALLLARELSHGPFLFAAVGSDGTDGPTDAGGAAIDGQTWARALGCSNPDKAIACFDTYPLLDRLGALIRMGSTGTNLLDLHLLARLS